MKLGARLFHNLNAKPFMGQAVQEKKERDRQREKSQLQCMLQSLGFGIKIFSRSLLIV